MVKEFKMSQERYDELKKELETSMDRVSEKTETARAALECLKREENL